MKKKTKKRVLREAPLISDNLALQKLDDEKKEAWKRNNHKLRNRPSEFDIYSYYDFDYKKVLGQIVSHTKGDKK